ncbi:uncharacterized protein NPIL_523081 [Nephila pilipes]|uniref:Uncharacterized protein n=1 Tax=Nephila pilipes TaxID=299642 RepID=A0A8X6U867_NEPPI|nr:uncharacterized protein NPIL_523081 [Nephila pilipes]
MHFSSFVLSEGSKTDIVLPDVNSIKFKQFTTAFIFRCLMESLGWLIVKLVVNVYPQYLSSKEYTNILKTVLENHMKYYSAGDLTGRKQINIHETKIIMALQIIELGFIESTHWAKIIDLLLALIKKTDPKAILLIIMNIIKKLCVYVFYNSYHKKEKIRSLIQEVATRIGLQFQNDKKNVQFVF